MGKQLHVRYCHGVETLSDSFQNGANQIQGVKNAESHKEEIKTVMHGVVAENHERPCIHDDTKNGETHQRNA